MTDTSSSPLRLAVDVGGTFTDVVVHNVSDGTLRFDKVPTTPSEPSEGVLASFARVEADPRRVNYFAHGTTLGLNALLTRTGATTAIVTTLGFRDVYLLGRTDRTVAYDFRYKKPPSLVRRRHIFEVPERLNFKGEVLKDFDVDAARRVATNIRELGIDSVAVCFLHAYANPSHEVAMQEVLADVAPQAEVTMSHSLTREYREYERASTAVLDAYIRPLVRKYISRLENSLSDGAFGGRFFMIRSGGGAMTAVRAKEAPVNLILSGPAGGVIGAASFGAATDEPNLITVDMGGTSLDASLIIGGQPVVHSDAAFEGLPIMMPSLYINTIGAGGGSVVWIDAASHLQVGPQSAGAVPGPAAYGQGGTSATLTDAALVCQYLGSETALAGTLRLDPELARRALEPLGDSLGMSVDHIAFGAMRIAVTKIVGAIRAITVEWGHRPGDFALLAFGGAGGLVAADVARELAIAKVIIPPGPGSFSALGMLMADVQHDQAQTFVTKLLGADLPALEGEFREMETHTIATLEQDGFSPARRKLIRLADLRYQGQEHTVAVPVESVIDSSEVERLSETFAEAHRLRYGHALSDPVEIVTLRCRGIGLVERPELPRVGPRPSGHLNPRGSRLVYQPDETRRAYAVYHREDCYCGDRIVGPAVISEHTSTTVLHDGDSAVIGQLGELRIDVAPESYSE
ncbi:MAG: hydantoinase/oxoprolinase family protein [Candidatus Dormiibacterota bacterium]